MSYINNDMLLIVNTYIQCEYIYNNSVTTCVLFSIV